MPEALRHPWLCDPNEHASKSLSSVVPEQAQGFAGEQNSQSEDGERLGARIEPDTEEGLPSLGDSGESRAPEHAN